MAILHALAHLRFGPTDWIAHFVPPAWVLVTPGGDVYALTRWRTGTIIDTPLGPRPSRHRLQKIGHIAIPEDKSHGL